MLIDGFNAEFKNIAAGSLKDGYEYMSEILFRMIAKGNLPHLSYIFSKPETLGVEFKKVACSVLGDLPFIEVHRGKEGTNRSNYHKENGYRKGATKDCLYIYVVLLKEVGRSCYGSWCRVDFYGEYKYQSILQGDH